MTFGGLIAGTAMAYLTLANLATSKAKLAPEDELEILSIRSANRVKEGHLSQRRGA